MTIIKFFDLDSQYKDCYLIRDGKLIKLINLSR